MKPTSTIRRTMTGWRASILLGAGLMGLGLALAQAQPPAPEAAPASTNSAPVKVKAPKPEPRAPRKALTGAELYSINCNRCHQERYPTERTGAQWKTVMLHMQVRANIPVKQAKLILQYLQENSGR